MAFEYTPAERHAVLTNSVERIINSSLEVLDYALRHHDRFPEATLEYASVAYEDWLELKQLVTKIWNEKRDQFFRDAQE
jgi:hypothetical protein